MAQDPNAPQDLSLEDLEWPDQPADGNGGTDGSPGSSGSTGDDSSAPAKDQPAGGGIFDRTTRTVDEKGNVTVDLSGVIKEVNTPWTRGGSKRDSDGDGLSDEYERMHDTDPDNADTDGDGFSDATEDEWGMGTATVWSPPNANADDVDGDGVSNLKEIQQGTSPVIDGHAAAGLGTDATEGARRYYERHKTGDAIGDAWLRSEYNVPATPAEQQAVDDAVAEQLFSNNPLTRLRAEEALAGFDREKVPQRASDAADQFIKEQTDKAVAEALATNDPAKIAGALRHGQLAGGLTESQTSQLEGAFRNLTDKAVAEALATNDPAKIAGALRHGQLAGGLTESQTSQLEGAFRNLLEPPGAKPGTGQPGSGGPGAGGAGGGTGGGTGAGTGPGNDSDGSSSTDPGMGPGFDPAGRRDPGDAGGGTGDGGTGGTGSEPGTTRTPPTSPAEPPASTPGWLDAADSLTAGNADAADTQGVGAMGSRGDGGGSGVGLSIGSLGTRNDGIGNSPSTSTTPTTGQQHGAGPGGSRESEPSNPASDSINPVTRPDGTVDHYEQPHADGSKSIYTTNGDLLYTIPPATTDGATGSAEGADAGAGTTDDGSDAGNEEPTDDDTNDSGVPDDGNSGEATAYINPDADSTGGGIAIRSPIHGGGFTDGGRGDLPTVDLTGVVPVDPLGAAGTEHVDPDADGSGGGFAFRTPIHGGGFTDFGRDLPTIDLTGITPHDPNDGTNALGAGEEAAATGDGIVFGTGGGTDGGGDGIVSGSGGGGGGGGGTIISGMAFGGDGSFSMDDVAVPLQIDQSSFQLDDFAARGSDMDLPAPGGDQMGDPDGDGLPFP